MTNNQHGQVPEALIDLIDAYAETRHRYGRIYNARTEAARNAVIEALSGVQALSAAPEAIAKLRHLYQNMVDGAVRDTASAKRIAEGLLAPAIEALERATPPAEQQATKETSGGFHVWRDISTAPKDGSRFVATGHNYGLYGEVRHTCVAQWFLGCWMEASDWNETSELKYLTHWMPLPSPPDDVAAPAEQQAAPKAAPGEPMASAAKGAIMGAAYDFRDAHISGSMNLKRSAHAALEDAVDNALAAQSAPQQEAQEPYAYAVYFPDQPTVELVHDLDELTDDLTNREYQITKLYAAPQPAPAPLSESIDQVERALAIIGVVGAIDGHDVVRRESVLEIARRAALAAQGGK